MKIGTIKEVKDHEERVGLTPFVARALVAAGHEVFVESGAGIGAGFTNVDYNSAGATILHNATEVAKKVDLLVKVKEPIKREFTAWLGHMSGKTVFAYLHLSANKELAEVLVANKITGVSYDTIEDEHGNLPMLKPMSEIAGRASIDLAREYLGQEASIRNITIVGGGVVGVEAARHALKQPNPPCVTIFEKSQKRISELLKIFDPRPKSYGTVATILDIARDDLLARELGYADLLVGAVLVKGARAPTVVTEEHLKFMKPGAMVFDIAIDQGGCVYGSRPTTYSNPTYKFGGHLYCCIPNLPGQRPVEATAALTELTAPHVCRMANQGVIAHLMKNPGWMKGLNTHFGYIRNKTIAEDLGMTGQYLGV